jgi:LAS superfamily LD-carboxypeptidase LdcB
MNVEKTDFLTGRFDPAVSNEFVLLKEGFCAGQAAYMLQEAAEALCGMIDLADNMGVRLRVVSAFRSFSRQKEIWEAKWTGKQLTEGQNLAITLPDPVERAKRILRYSAMPGTSRHHWGTDVDLNSVEPDYFETSEGRAVFDWLIIHAARFGFARPYTVRGIERPGGYEEEKWHWSYLPKALQLLQSYNRMITYADLTGFEGAETAAELEVIAQYVNGIHHSCKPEYV